MGGPNCTSNLGLKKGPWTREEDQKLLSYIEEHGHGSWRTLPTKAGLQRCGKSCRLRWTNYLRPDIRRGKFSIQEEKAIIRLHALLGNRWSAIAAHLPKRTDNEIKNYWNTRLKKRLSRMGIDPATHKPKNTPVKSAAISHMAQWEAARLEAEARLAREYKLPVLHKPPMHLVAAAPCLDVLRVWQSTTIPSCFFSSSSTLNSSSTSLTVPAVSSIVSNDVISTNAEYDACGLGPVDGYELHHHQIAYTGCGLMGASFNQDSDSYVDFEDSNDYWNYLLNVVSSPLMGCHGL